jgi:hypothetical protein
VPQSTMALRQVKHVCRVLFMRADQSECHDANSDKRNPNLVREQLMARGTKWNAENPEGLLRGVSHRRDSPPCLNKQALQVSHYTNPCCAAVVGFRAMALYSTPARTHDGDYERYCYFHRYDPACWRYWHRDYDEHCYLRGTVSSDS